MLNTFRVASRTQVELAEAKKQFDEMIIDTVRGSNGKYNKRGEQKLNENKYEIAEVLIQLINDTVATTDPMDLLVEQIEGSISDTYVWQEMRASLRVVARAYGSKPLSQRLTFKEWSMSTSAKEINVDLPLEEIAGGRVSPSLVADQMAFAVNRHRISMVLDAIDAGVPSQADRTGKSGYTLRYTGLTKDNLEHAIDGLADENDEPTIIGRRIALFPAIRAFDGWSEQALQGFEARGVTGNFMGAPILVLSDPFSKVAGSHVIRNDRVYLSAKTKGAKFMTKNLDFLNYAVVDERTATFSTGLRMEDGLLVHDPYRYRIIEI